MTNTLHRYGSAESLADDYIVFAIPARGFNDKDVDHKQRRFLEIARRFDPVNLGDASHGGIFRPSHSLMPAVHWKRKSSPDFDTVLAGVSGPTTVAAVFDQPEKVVDFIKALKQEDLGLSINISANLEKARECARLAGIESAAQTGILLLRPGPSRVRKLWLFLRRAGFAAWSIA